MAGTFTRIIFLARNFFRICIPVSAFCICPTISCHIRLAFVNHRAMIRPILIHPDPRLKKLCEPVAEITADLRQLAADMLETMYDAPGVGLAAPQVGVTKRLIVMDCIKDGPPEPMALFNPEVIWSSPTRQSSHGRCWG